MLSRTNRARRRTTAVYGRPSWSGSGGSPSQMDALRVSDQCLPYEHRAPAASVKQVDINGSADVGPTQPMNTDLLNSVVLGIREQATVDKMADGGWRSKELIAEDLV